MNLDKAIHIAVKAHAGQTRKNGTPYVLHPLRLMFKQASEEAMITAVLHDVVEDTDITIDDLKQHGFPETVLIALELLTHDDDIPYEGYIERITTNALARAVKLADLEDNMNVCELPDVTQKDLERTAKYYKAWANLKHVGKTIDLLLN